MSGISSNRGKKNGKKGKFLNVPEVMQVKSLKLDSAKPNKDARNGARSEDNLMRKSRRSIISKNRIPRESECNGDATELETNMVRKIKNMTLSNEGEYGAPSTSFYNLESRNEEGIREEDQDEEPLLPMNYTSERGEAQGNFDNFAAACSYKYYTKHSKSIKFTNQVTVLYFNGEDVLCESMEPLKKETDQQLRNKEMRKEHLISRGQIDNVYLF